MGKKPSASSSYVQPYKYPSPNVPLSAIRRFARQIAERFRPHQIILFGSYAYGRPTEDSDVDLLVLMTVPPEEVRRKVVEIRLRVPHPYPLDLLVRSPEQIDYRVALNDWFFKEVMEKGQVLYERPNTGVCAEG